MDFLNKLDRKFGKFSIPYLYIAIIVCTGIGYALYYLAPDIYNLITLNPYMLIYKHQYWRLFTWIFTIPYPLSGLNIIFLPINMYFYFYVGRNLEMVWGRFIYNLYVIGTAFLIDLFVVLLGLFQFYGSPMKENNIQIFERLSSQYPVDLDITYIMFVSIFLGFSIIFGEQKVLLYFVIPLKMKWLAWIDLAYLGYLFIANSDWTYGPFVKVVILAVVIVYFTFFLISRKNSILTPADIRRKQKYQKAVKQSQELRRRDAEGRKAQVIEHDFSKPRKTAMHRCTICGRTENDDPDLEFRFCSKCNGTHEYCSDHLYTHEHIN